MGLWSWFKGLFGKNEEPQPTSLVLLLREHRYLDDRIIRQAVEKAFGVDLSDTGPDATEFVAGGDGLPTHFVQFQDRVLLVHHFAEPYFGDQSEQMAAGCADLRLARAIREHRAWLSVDVLSPREAGENAYLVIGKLLAELADEDCLAIVAPALQQMSPWEPALAATLRGTQPLDAVRVMSQVPVVEVSGDDPLMVAAVAEARGRWPEFVAAFEVRRPEQNFAVKAPFREGEFREFLWLGVTAIEHDTICGKIDNDPVELKQVQSGSRVQVAVPEINDWVYTDGDNLQGGFTIEALRKAAQRKTK